MESFFSWWVMALIVGGTATLWVRLLSDRWEKQTRVRTKDFLERAGASCRQDAHRP